MHVKTCGQPHFTEYYLLAYVHTYIHIYPHMYIHASLHVYIPWIHNLVKVTTGGGVSHKVQSTKYKIYDTKIL
jgi:hypothetical protein